MRTEPRVTLPATTDSRFCDRKNQFCAGMEGYDAYNLWGRDGVKDFKKLDSDNDDRLSYEEIMADQYKKVKKQKRWKTAFVVLSAISAAIDIFNKKAPYEAVLFLCLAGNKHKKMLSAKGEYSEYEKMYEQILAEQQKIEENVKANNTETVVAEAA